MAVIKLTEIKQGEAKPITFTVTRDGVPEDLSTATVSMVFKENKDGSILINKADGDFDKSQASNGKVTVTLTTTDTTTGIGVFTDELKTFIGEFKIIFTALTDVDKSLDLILPVRRAVDC
jgi:hypothetical protein